MVRRVFFSFHYENDVWRANQVRNSWVTKEDRKAAGFIDSADFEKLKQQGEDAVRKWIDGQLENTSVTVILIGAETSNRKWVRYELQKSYEKGNSIIGVYIHNLKDKDGNTSNKGDATFGEIGKDKEGKTLYYHNITKGTYDYVNDKGYDNLGIWIENATKDANR